MREILGIFDWFSIVDDNLLLGAIPLEDSHFSKLAKGLGIGAVLSIVQPFEFSVHTVVGTPVLPIMWKKYSVNHLALSSRDYLPPSFAVLDEGAAFLNAHLSNNVRVYCHCKSGVGRSASVVMAYFMRFKGFDARTAHSKLQARRKWVFSADSANMRNMLAYEAHIKGLSDVNFKQ